MSVQEKVAVRESLLVVDDEEMNRQALSRRLERNGFHVELAEGGIEALNKVNGGARFDLILLDEMMPGKSGADVLRELRSQYSPTELPVIMVTAVTDSGRVAEALDLGANDYVTKPVDFTVALARIRAQLSRKTAESARRLSEERYELAARAANDGLWDWDLESNRVYYSTRWKDMMGLRDSEVGTSPEEWFSRVHADDVVALRSGLQRHLDGVSGVFEAEYRVRFRDGSYRWMASRGMALRNPDGKAGRMAGSQSDITGQKTLDALTGLPNRILFQDQLTAALERTGQEPGRHLAVCFIDLDRFKLVNDTLGHVAGDALLVQFAERMRLVVADRGTGRGAVIARLGGDEFAMLLEGVENPNAAPAECDKLIRAMRPAFLLEGQEFFVSASVGIVISRPEHTSAEALIRDADIAMYSAKARGRGRWAMFDDSMRERALNRLQMETDLRGALAKGEFVIHYQPRVDLTTHQIRGFEALIRWQHPVRGLIPPDDFIHIAEETGLIREIGMWVMGEACEQVCRWRREFPSMPWLDVAVNVSPVQLRDPGLPGQIAQILTDTGLQPSALQIEVTESTLLENLDQACSILTSLKDLGVGLKLDDFATGYSCLRYLYRLPFDSIKIDRSFTFDLDHNNPESKELIHTIMSMAENLNLGVIAEGVETLTSANYLRDEGCKFGQGYYFSPAVCRDDAVQLLNKQA